MKEDYYKMKPFTQVNYRYLKAMSRMPNLTTKQLALILKGCCVGISEEKVAQLRPSLIRLNSLYDLEITPPVRYGSYSRSFFWVPFGCYADTSVFALGFKLEPLIRLVLMDADKNCNEVYIFGTSERHFNPHLMETREKTIMKAIYSYTNQIIRDYGK